MHKNCFIRRMTYVSKNFDIIDIFFAIVYRKYKERAKLEDISNYTTRMFCLKKLVLKIIPLSHEYFKIGRV